MSGLKRRLTRRRATEPEPAAGPPDESVAEPAERSLLDDPAAEQPTEQLPVTEVVPSEPTAAPEPAAPAPPLDDLPAGVDPEELAAAPDSSARRGRLRRRIEFLRSARELLLRDLGGFVYELHRTARDAEQEGHRRLRTTKLERLDRIDTELHELEQRLDDPRRRVLVREPGVGGECHRCGELFGSDANYCAHCGAPLTETARKARLKAERPRGEPAAAGEAAPAEAAVAAEGAGLTAPEPAPESAPAEAVVTAEDARVGAPEPAGESAGVGGDEEPGITGVSEAARNGASPDAVTEVQSGERPG